MVDEISLTAVRNKILELGKKINAPEEYLLMRTKTDHFGYPHIEVKDGFYHFIVIDRGTVARHSQTKDIDLLLYWYFECAISEMASTYEINHKNPDQDFRRIWFARQIELMRILSPIWTQWLKKELDEVLGRVPFSDP